MKVSIVLIFALFAFVKANPFELEQLAHAIANSLQLNLESTTSSFTGLLQNGGNNKSDGNSPLDYLLSNKSAKIEVGLFGGLVVNIESEGHKVQLNSSLGGGLRLNVNQKDSNSHEDLHKIKTEVDHFIEHLEANETGIGVASVFGGNETTRLIETKQKAEQKFNGGFGVGIKFRVNHS